MYSSPCYVFFFALLVLGVERVTSTCYAKISSGTCTSNGYADITSLSSCNAAVAAFNAQEGRTPLCCTSGSMMFSSSLMGGCSVDCGPPNDNYYFCIYFNTATGGVVGGSGDYGFCVATCGDSP